MKSTRKPEPVPGCSEQIEITPATASQVRVPVLKQSLNDVGLTCEQTSDSQLVEFIGEVRSNFPQQQPGDSQGFFIGARVEGLRKALQAEAGQFIDAVSHLGFDSVSHARVAEAASLPDAANFYRHILKDNPGGVEYVNQLTKATWEESDAAAFAHDLARDNPYGVLMLVKLSLKDIQAVATADWMAEDGPQIGPWSDGLSDVINQATFNCLSSKSGKVDRYSCHKGQQPDKRWGLNYSAYFPYTNDLSTSDAVTKQYSELADNISATTVKGMDHPSLEAALANVMNPTMHEGSSDYDSRTANGGKDSERVIFFADNPTFNSQGDVTECDGVGVIDVTWRLQVQNYKSKKHKTHTTSFEVWTRSMFYPSVYGDNNTTTIGNQLTDDCNLCPVRSN
ncbi:lectin [Mycobacterium montefiorense]|uniref:lectin n=2 Tax=Mycobacterium montefiorense TaxID=154654 RepID=UPI0021F309F8|nr:lectin [Mycobacterium montefiorense]MCV7427170.1 lectin [Mycobacterium montefiorense]